MHYLFSLSRYLYRGTPCSVQGMPGIELGWPAMYAPYQLYYLSWLWPFESETQLTAEESLHSLLLCSFLRSTPKAMAQKLFFLHHRWKIKYLVEKVSNENKKLALG